MNEMWQGGRLDASKKIVVGIALIKVAQEKRLAELVRKLRQALDSGWY